jgi:hypothetical protein
MSKRKSSYRHVNATDRGSRIRVRGKRLDQVDETKLTLAYWLLAKQLVVDKTTPRLPSAEEVEAKAKDITDDEADAYRRRCAS